MKNTEIKRVIKSGGKSRLMLSEAAGQLWATDSYWLVRAAAVSPLLDHYNLPLAAGVFEVNGQVSRTEIDPPNVGALIPTDLAKLTTIEPVQVCGDNALIRRDGRLLALYSAVGAASIVDNAVALADDYLSFVLASIAALGTLSERYELVRVARDAERGVGPAVFIGHKVIRSGGYAKLATATTPYEYVPETWDAEPAEIVLGLLMPVRITLPAVGR